MEFDSKLQVFGVYVGARIMDLPYMSHCHPGLCSSVVSRFLSSIWSLTIGPLLQSILEGSTCGSLPSIYSCETGTTVSKQLGNKFLKTCTLVLCIFLPALHSQQWAFFGYFESGGFFNFYLSYGECSEFPL